jgi:hypothetical protein
LSARAQRSFAGNTMHRAMHVMRFTTRFRITAIH